MRLLRRLFQAVLVVLTLMIGATSAAIIVSQTAWFRDWLRTYLVRESHRFLNGDLTVGRLGGNLFTGLQLENVGVKLENNELIAIDAIELDYDIVQLVSGGLAIDEIRIVRPSIHLRQDADGWTIARLVKRQEREADREGPLAPISIDAIRVHDGSVAFDSPLAVSGVNVPKRVERIDADLAFKYEPVHYSIEVTQLSFRAAEPELALNTFSGGIAVKDDTLYLDRIALKTAETGLSIDGSIEHYLSKPVMQISVSSEKLALFELAPIVPALATVNLQPAFELKLNGPADRLGVEANVRTSAGQADAKLTLDLMAPEQSIAGTLSVRRLDLSQLVNDKSLRTDLTADATVAVRAASISDADTYSGTASVRAARVAALGYEAQRVSGDVRFRGRTLDVNARASAYGSDATTHGRVVLAQGSKPLRYDLRGRIARFDLRRMPDRFTLPKAESNLQAAYHVVGSEPSSEQPGVRVLDADATLGESTFAGVRIADGSTAGVTLRGRDLAYRAEATVAGADLERIGRELNLGALADSRYRTNLNGTVSVDGHGTDPKAMELSARGTLKDSTLLEGQVPALNFDGTLSGGTLHVKAAGAFAEFNPAVLSGRDTMDGKVAGTLDVDVTVVDVTAGVRPDTVTASGQVMLLPSTIGGIAIDHATVDGDYRDSTGDIRTLEVAGLDLNVRANGTLALNDTGASALTVHADSPSIEEVGKLFDLPLSGIAAVDATVTGNRRELVAKGKLTGSGLKYEENGALSVTSDFTVKVPELALEQAEADAITDAAFVTVAGQEINQLNATAKYANRQLDVEATARQRERTLGVAGELLMHPDHQEVHVRQASFDTRGIRWELAPGSEATVSYAADRIDVQGMQLVSGDQTITADGTFGSPTDSLNVTLRNVNLEAVDAMLLRAPQFAGRANATAAIRGPKSALQVDGSFEVSSGAFRSFKYDSLGGTVKYSGSGVIVDARLQQNPTQWATAKGYVPVALFSQPAREASDIGAHVPPASPEESIDLVVETSPIDLGVVQGFTTALTDVTGTVQANVRVTGSAQDPHPEGTITIANGFATVEPVGVRYRNIAGRIDLQPDRLHIDQITLLDNQESALTITGDLAVHAREVGAVQLKIAADRFKVVDNKLGNVRIKSDIAITGELRAPRIEGTLGITTGTVNVDQIMAFMGASPYSTTALDTGTKAEESAEAAGPGLFENLTMNVRVQVPNDLVLKASSLEAAGSPVGLGSLNVTLGGDVRATKERGDTLRLVGVVNTVRGNYDFQGRRFEILRDGTIRFENLEEFDPTLDVRTRRMIQGVEARADIRGTLRRPEIHLSSVPPFPEADILSLIVFNAPINELGTGEQISLAARAQALAGGAIAAQLANSIGGILNVDTFEINLAPESGNSPEITLGEQVGKNLYLRIQQSVGDLSTTNVIIEYELKRWLRFRTNIVQNGTQTQQSLFRRAESTGADMLFFFSY